MDNITTTQASDKANVFQPLIDANRDKVFGILDTETRRAKDLRKRIANIVYSCGNSEAADAVLGALEKSWRREHAEKDKDGKVVSMPKIPGSYRTTKSAIFKAIQDAPSLTVDVRENARESCLETGASLEEALGRAFGPEGDSGFLVFFGERYLDDKGNMDDTRYFKDVDRAKMFSAARKSRQERFNAKAAKATGTGGTMATGDGTEPEALPEIVGAALNRLIAAVRGNRGAIDDDKNLAIWLDDAAQYLAQWARESLEASAEAPDKAANA